VTPVGVLDRKAAGGATEIMCGLPHALSMHLPVMDPPTTMGNGPIQC